MRYFIKTPWWLKKIYPGYVWDIKTHEKNIYLTFDDGPHPVATPFVLDQLKKYNAKASFFCIGKNVLTDPGLYERILREGHAVGNHTQHHLNGWKTNDEVYLEDIITASKNISSSLFRPPYGRIRGSQVRSLRKKGLHGSPQIIMWSILSGDFDESISKEICLKNVLRGLNPGHIIVFHDSEKAFPRLAYTLPRLLEEGSQKGYSFKKIE